jgi:hypothetical protein
VNSVRDACRRPRSPKGWCLRSSPPAVLRARAGSDVVDAVEQAVWTRCLDAVGIKSTTGAATLSCAGRADRIVQHVYRQTRKLSRIAIICHSKSALDIHDDGCATLAHGQMTSDDRERRSRPAAGTAAADISR